MNPSKATSITAPTEDIAPTPKSAPGTRHDARSNQLLLVGIALLAVWIALVALNSIKEINTDLDEVHGRFMQPTYSRS